MLSRATGGFELGRDCSQERVVGTGGTGGVEPAVSFGPVEGGLLPATDTCEGLAQTDVRAR